MDAIHFNLLRQASARCFTCLLYARRMALLLVALLMFNTSGYARPSQEVMKSDRLCSEMVSYNGEAYFCYEHPLYGAELHRTNGNQHDTKVVIDIDPGPGGSNPGTFFVWNSELYFVAENTATGTSLWKTNGSASGTVRLKTIPDLADRPRDVSAKNKLSATSSRVAVVISIHGPNILITTDGTSSGTFAHESVKSAISRNNKIYTLYSSAAKLTIRELQSNGLIGALKFTGSLSNCGISFVPEYSAENKFLINYFSSCGALADLGSLIINISSGNVDTFELGRYWYIGVKNGTHVYLDDAVDQKIVETSDFKVMRTIPEVVSLASNETVPRANKIFRPVGEEIQVIDIKSNAAYQPGIRVDHLYPFSANYASNVRSDGSFFGIGVDGNDKSIMFADGSVGPAEVVKTYLNPLTPIHYVMANSKFYFFVQPEHYHDAYIRVTNGTEAGSYGIRLDIPDAPQAISAVGLEGDRLYFQTRIADSKKESLFANKAIWHTQGSRDSTYLMMLDYDDGRPVPTYIPPIIDLVLE